MDFLLNFLTIKIDLKKKTFFSANYLNKLVELQRRFATGVDVGELKNTEGIFPLFWKFS